MTRTFRTLPVLLFALGARGVSAEDIDIKLGTEVLVTTSGATIAGTLAGRDQKAIVLRRRDELVEFPLAEVEELDVMRPGRKGHYPEMILAGAVSGALMGAWAGVGGVNSGPIGRTDSQVAKDTETGAAVGAALGAVGGYMISRFVLHRAPHWEKVEVHPTIRIGAMPVRGRGLGLAVSVAF